MVFIKIYVWKYMMINKIWCKIAIWFSYVLNIFLWHSIRFPRINLSSAIKTFNVFFSLHKHQIILKDCWRIIFFSIKSTSSFLKSFVNSFVDTALNFSNSSFYKYMFFFYLKLYFYLNLLVSHPNISFLQS